MSIGLFFQLVPIQVFIRIFQNTYQDSSIIAAIAEGRAPEQEDTITMTAHRFEYFSL